MYLKKLEVDKFKSFSKHLTVPLFPGFTAITGPNGSGKSNLCDAILFVLGPKSPKTVRAGRLTDLIYNGGRSKQAASQCKVSLVFDNEDRTIPIEGGEVTLTRVIRKVKKENDPDGYYSYFYINDRSASLNDFTNLLSNSGMNGYNIIQQGTITRLVDMVPSERRKLIDDLAGITKFDREIEKAEQEKIEVEENLKRIRIILKEVEKQIRQLRRERDQAIRYKEAEDGLNRAKAKLALKKKWEFETELKQSNGELETYQVELSRCEDRSSELKKEKEEIRNQLHELDRRIAESTEAKKLTEQIEQSRERLIRTEEQLNYLKKEREADIQDKGELDDERLRIVKTIEEKSAEGNKLERELDRKKLDAERARKEVAQIKNKIGGLAGDEKSVNQELFQLKQKWEEKQKKIYGLRLERDGLERLTGDLKRELEGLGGELEKYQTELKEREWKIREVKKTIDQKTKIKTELLGKLEEERKRQNSLKEKMRRIEESLPDLRRECEKFKEAMSSQQGGGYSRAINALLKKRGEIHGIMGPVIELISFDDKYWKAVQASGGGRLFSMVVTNDSVAAKCIEHLKANGLGRAVFLPLNKLHKGTIRASALLKMKSGGVEGLVKDLVKARDELEAVLWWAFGDTLLVKNLDLARRLMGGVRLVTLDGELIETSGAITGGSLTKVSITKRVLSTEDPIKKLSDAEAKKVELEKELIRVVEEIEDLKERIAEVSQRSEEQYGEMELEREKFKGNVRQLQEKKNQRAKNLKDCEEKQESLKSQIGKIEDEILELDKIREEKSKALAEESPELKQKINDKEEKASILGKEISEMEARLGYMQSQIDLIKSREDEIKGRIDRLEGTLKNTQEEIEGLSQKYSKEKKAYEGLLFSNEEIRKKLEKIYKEREKLQNEELEFERELERAQLEKECKMDSIRTVQGKLDTLRLNLKQINEEIESYEVEIAENIDSETLESIKFEIRGLEEKLKDFGPVNMLAIKEWDEKKDRERMHEEEISRLKQQKRDLTKLVEEIKKHKKEKFFEVFDSLNERYKETYAALSGGEAELLLENPSEPFEGGLTIKARPKGKKAMRLPALSGGEKSLASLALVFAIQKFLPSPFYVLDEADMFLDNLNAGAVASMIKENSGHAQWITISLHEAMLKAADHIYGVTMQEADSSKIVGGVNLGG
ncbi:MAG TPA: chromosome segregation protein SMC [Thermoplasmata archaeon]|nr:chromosome segregation protein SMC [Thermoplasmata archaeon]